MTNILLLAVILFIIGGVITVLKGKAQGGRRAARADVDAAPAVQGKPVAAIADEDDKTVDVTGYVKRRYLFSPAEYSFYKVLVMAVGDRCTILVKVRMADLIEVRKGTSGWQAKFNRIAKKHVDFVLCEPKTMVIQAVIELDDSSHDTDSQQKRDAFVDAVYAVTAIPVLHVPAARDYQVQDLRRQVEDVLAAPVPA